LAQEEADSQPGEAYQPETVRLSDAEKLDWIRLIRSDSIGPVTFHELIRHFKTAGAALEAIPELRGRANGSYGQRICSRADAEAEWDAAQTEGATVLACVEADYPALLKHIPSPPPILFVKGRTDLAHRKTVAIVGSRNASAAGRHFTADLARDLGGAGVVIASGLARGIDTAAHEASLATGTIAAVAGGVDMIYPPENAGLHRAIADHGLLLSESPPGAVPRGQDFPRRNRIISGLASGVVVVEAARKSGSLITARLALEQGRDVFAVPGHPLDPRASGTNGLIKGGAQLITCAQDIMSELFSGLNRSPIWNETPPDALSPSNGRSTIGDTSADETHKRILSALSYTPIHPDTILRQTGLSARMLTAALLELDLRGRIERHDDQRISLKPVSVEAR